MGDNDVTQLHRRLDKQDIVLTEIRDQLIAHVAKYEEVSPHLKEMVSLWQGSKIIAFISAAVAAFAGALWGTFVWAKDHIK